MRRKRAGVVRLSDHAYERWKLRVAPAKRASVADRIRRRIAAELKNGAEVNKNGALEVEIRRGVWAICYPSFMGGWDGGESWIGKNCDFSATTFMVIRRFKMIDLLLGGSPCQGFSKTVSNNLNFEHPESRLFFEYAKALKILKPRYFLLENVSMEKWCQDVISEYVGVEPIIINSNLVSAQDRERLYWTNIKGITQPKNKGFVLADIIQPAEEVEEKYWYNVPFDYHGEDARVCATLHINGHDILKRVYNLKYKSPTLTACRGGNLQKKVFQNGRCRKLTPLEYERLQTLPDGYTDGISDSQRYNTLGDGWTVDVIAHILSFIPEKYLHTVVSLFDGISCGQIALERVGKIYNQYYASEINKYAIAVTQKNYPHTMQLGDVTKIDWDAFLREPNGFGVRGLKGKGKGVNSMWDAASN